MLFLNYPDRMALRQSPYALGYWGIILAPPVQRLADYAVAEQGRSAAALELARLPVGVQQWLDSPYTVDWRGERVDAPGLLPGKATYDGVFATTVSPSGDLRLESVGWAPPSEGGPTIAVMGDRLVLRDATVAPEGGDRLNVMLVLQPTGDVAPDDVVFIHVLDATASLVAGADDDLWGSYLPLETIPAAMLDRKSVV